MRITATGHAGLFLETERGSVLCDPWRTPAYFASWFVFPDNSEVDFAAFKPDFLYISHLHRDHFDPELLEGTVPKSTTVLLPEFPTDELRSALRDLGFRSFVQTKNGEPIELNGLRVMITAMVSPSDGPIGDSALSLDDGEVRVLNQNDARPPDPAHLNAFGDYDGHFLQFSGAIWWPVAYELVEATKAEHARRKRLNGMERARRFVDAVGARFVFPTAGPPCFLDDDLFEHNDFLNSPDNIFPDQTVFLAYLEKAGLDNGRLLVPGSTATLSPFSCEVTHSLDDDELASVFADKRSYLEAYAARQRDTLSAARRSWPRYDNDLLAALKGWWEPLLSLADHICEGVGAPVLLDLGEEKILIDFPAPRGSPLFRRRVPLPLHHRPAPCRSPCGGPRDRLGKQPVPLYAVSCPAAGPFQRVRLRLFQVPFPRAHVVRRGLVRREVGQRGPRQARRIHGAAPLPASKGRPRKVRDRLRGGARVRDARMAFRARDRSLPDGGGP